MAIVGCPLCENKMKSEYLNEHYSRKHPDYPGPRLSQTTKNFVRESFSEGALLLLFSFFAALCLIPLVVISIPAIMIEFLNNRKFWEE